MNQMCEAMNHKSASRKQLCCTLPSPFLLQLMFHFVCCCSLVSPVYFKDSGRDETVALIGLKRFYKVEGNAAGMVAPKNMRQEKRRRSDARSGWWKKNRKSSPSPLTEVSIRQLWLEKACPSWVFEGCSP